MRRCEHHTGTTPLIQLLPGDCTAPSSSRRPVPRLSRAGRCPWSVCLCLPPYPHPDGPLCPLAPCCLSLSVFTMLQHSRCRPLTHRRCSLHYPLLVTQCVQSTMLETRARQNQTGYSGVTLTICRRGFSSVHLSCSVVSDSLQPHGLQHARLPCPSLVILIFKSLKVLAKDPPSQQRSPVLFKPDHKCMQFGILDKTY